MTNGIFRRTLVGAAVATALSVLATPAGAAPYRGTFDPTDFSGEYIIDVNPACLLLSGWQANTGVCSATLTSAYANVLSTSPEPTYNGVLTFAPPTISSSSVLFGLWIYGGAIDGFDTTPIHHVGASPATVDNWWIEFVSGHMPAPPCNYCYPGNIPGNVVDLVGTEGAPALGRGVYLFANQTNTPIAMAQFIGPAVFVPEPGTLSLALGALGGGWLARRRRKEKESS